MCKQNSCEDLHFFLLGLGPPASRTYGGCYGKKNNISIGINLDTVEIHKSEL